MQSATGTCWHTKVNDGWLVGCASGIITTTVVLLLCQNLGTFTDNDWME
jgi:hypothetical protein